MGALEPGYQKGACLLCGGHIAFPMTAEGGEVSCPHCGGTTRLTADLSSASPVPAPVPSVERATPMRVTPGGRKRRKIWIPVVAVAVIVVGAAAFLLWKGRSGKQGDAGVTTVPARNKPLPSKAVSDLKAGPVELEKVPGSGLVYAVGVLTNDSGHQRFGVRVEFRLLDASQAEVGAARDYTQVIEPHQAWSFRAMVPEASAVRAEISKITEE